jgi:hypothetical protein
MAYFINYLIVTVDYASSYSGRSSACPVTAKRSVGLTSYKMGEKD